jgi:hypothetical protein
VTNGADPLAEYFVATARQSPGLAGRGEVRGQVDAILNELRIPAVVDKDGDWKLTTDVGPFILMVDGESSDLIAVQTIQSMEKKVKNSSDEMYVLLALNFEARGLARFGTVKDSGQDLLVLTARLAPETISSVSVEGMLTDCFRLSRRVDELLGNEPPQAPAQPGGWQAADAAIAQAEAAPAAPLPPPQAAPSAEPPPPEEAPVHAPAAETVFAQPVPPAAEAPPAEAPPAEPDPGLDFPPPEVQEPEPTYPPPAQTEPPPPQQELPPANWYDDPYQQARLRYWDGQSWTQHVAN